ncbi:MAG: glycoside hydrolase family 97 protein, partial [Acidimicrobiia bacterium]|nr:glycoside hydrolase family 97 protein [Acidimicrobiia bacterium]
TAVLARSDLGLVFEHKSFDRLAIVEVGDVEPVSESYHLVGKKVPIVVEANQRVVELENGDGMRVSLIVRVSNDAVGFRYRYSGSDDRIEAELTSFTFAEPGQAWIQPHEPPGIGSPAYEALYTNGVPIGHVQSVPSWNMPALFSTATAWVLLAESDVASGNFVAHLQPDGDLTYRLELPQPSEGMSRDPAGEPIETVWRSPWRLIIVSSDLAGLVESTAVDDFASPSRLDDLSWIRPGRVSWSWWSDHASPRNPDALRAFIDLSAEFRWEHTLIDANWNEMSEATLTGLLDHAADRHVGVFLWYNSGGSNNVVPEQPRDRMDDPQVRRAEMKWLASQGVAGIKVDFFQSDRTDIISRYLDIAEDAAAEGLMVNFHGCTAPKGWERTWPNVMTMEAVRGAEQYFFAPDYPETAIWHNTVLPFTRNVVGSMDYTPVTFSNQQYPHLTTAGHELALSVVFHSNLQHFADSVASYDALDRPVRLFLTDVPAVWDEVRLLDGHPGDYVVLARRSGDRWWIGGINGVTPRRVDVDVSALSRGGSWESISGPGLDVEEVDKESMSFNLAPGDGFVMWQPEH